MIYQRLKNHLCLSICLKNILFAANIATQSIPVPLTATCIKEQLKSVNKIDCDFIRDYDNRVVVYTDGCCLSNNNKNMKRRTAGIGVYWGIPDHPLNLSCKIEDKLLTSNRSEILAAHAAILFAHELELGELLNFTDSMYLVNACNSWLMRWATKQWRNSSGGKVKNIDLWKPFVQDFRSLSVAVKKCPGKNPNIEMAHKLANVGARF